MRKRKNSMQHNRLSIAKPTLATCNPDEQLIPTDKKHNEKKKKKIEMQKTTQKKQKMNKIR